MMQMNTNAGDIMRIDGQDKLARQETCGTLGKVLEWSLNFPYWSGTLTSFFVGFLFLFRDAGTRRGSRRVHFIIYLITLCLYNPL